MFRSSVHLARGEFGFTPDGDHLIVTTKGNGHDILVFDVGRDGRLSDSPVVNSSERGMSHTRRLLARVAGIMRTEGVAVELIHMLDHQIGFGMVKDTTEIGDARDDWPGIHAKIMSADILVIGTPIWLGTKSSVATLAVERLYAYSSDTNDRGQYLYYGKAGGCVVTGNEDGVKACAAEVLFALSHIRYVIPPQADCGWIGDIGPGPSYGDVIEGHDVPVGYDSEFTNKNATIMSWNLMHTAKMLKDLGGFPSGGNSAATWQNYTNAADQDPEAQ